MIVIYTVPIVLQQNAHTINIAYQVILILLRNYHFLIFVC